LKWLLSEEDETPEGTTTTIDGTTVD